MDYDFSNTADSAAATACEAPEMPHRAAVDGHEWMWSLRFAPYHVATLRRMRVGSTLWVGCLLEDVIKGSTGRCEACFRRVRGGWAFEARSTLQMPGRRKDREAISANGSFTLQKNSRIEFSADTTAEELAKFKLICRYLAHITCRAEHHGIKLWGGKGYATTHGLLRGEVIGKSQRPWRNEWAPRHCGENTKVPLPPELLVDTSEGRGRKNLFGRPELAAVYRKARDILVEHKTFRLCLITEQDQIKSLTICNFWRVDIHPDKSVRAFEFDINEARWQEVRTLEWWPEIPLYPVVKTQSLDWWRSVVTRTVWKALMAAGYESIKDLAPHKPFTEGKVMAANTMAQILIRRYVGTQVGMTKSGKPKYKQGVLEHKSMVAGARALRSAIFREILDGDVLSAMRAIDYKRIIELRYYLQMAFERDSLLRVAKERRNMLPMLPHIDRAHWAREDLFSHKLWVRGSRKRTLVDFKTFAVKNHWTTTQSCFTSFSSKAAFRWLSKAQLTVIKSWSENHEGRKDITAIENICKANINHRMPAIAWSHLLHYHHSVAELGVGEPVQRLYRIFAAHCAALWKDEGFVAVKTWLRAGSRIGDIADWLAAEGLAQGMPTRNTTWPALLRHSNDWHERVAVANYDNGVTRNETWESLVPATEIDGVTATPINSCRELALEGYRQHHCVGDYMQHCIAGRYRVYTIVEPDGTRSTLGIWWTKKQGWVFDQHRGKYNDPISPAAAKVGKAIFELYQGLQAAPPSAPVME